MVRRTHPVLKFVGGTSPGFREQVADAVDAIDTNALTLIHKARYTIYGVSSLVAADPELATTSTGAHNTAPSFAHVEGIAQQKKRRAMIAETYTSLVDDKPRRNARIGGAVRHEVGHVMSYILNNMSEDRLFQKAHAHDVGNLAKRVGAQTARGLRYYTAQTKRGRSEAYAEMWAQTNGGGSMAVDLTEAMPTVARYLQVVNRNIAAGRNPRANLVAERIGLPGRLETLGRLLTGVPKTGKRTTLYVKPAAEPKPQAEVKPVHLARDQVVAATARSDGDRNADKMAAWRAKRGYGRNGLAQVEPKSRSTVDLRA
ncbi:MAG: hypothetical protein CBB62_11270 [Micavibrio sp. TMED2]|nr:hypothetical protein [Alphaproteobacteria bacterium]MAS47917.1 hypothetical protein [Alphaproteobacteria bacterium]MAX97193.1 hypothetical protein [Alphaproteobacteria bacterium]OUT40047.1 MAG: hypothetical protein CBB62_11270 [Micavibrio sp. TMED2]|tara:strand:- start:24053 stop:24994 length:942 start_codon:yes stop_codon:yes gene_type:complete